MSEATVTIQRWNSLDTAEQERLLPAVETIFFAASGTQTFADDVTRAAFRERWLGRYLAHWPQWFYVALVDRDAAAGNDSAWLQPGTAERSEQRCQAKARHRNVVIGYLAGCLVDPATSPLFADLAYCRDLAPLTARFPAHLHINLDADRRGRGIGARLIETFAGDARAAGSSGLHVVTGAAARNVPFYTRLGLIEQGNTVHNGHAIVLLGRALA